MMVNATHAKQAEEVREISAITYGFMASKALFAAVEWEAMGSFLKLTLTPLTVRRGSAASGRFDLRAS
jgi:hypothetical protein